MKKGELFASRNQLRLLAPVTGTRHGKAWTNKELADLKQWFLEGNTIAELIDKSERNVGGVIPELKAAGLITDQAVNDIWGYDYYYAVDLTDIKQPEHQPEPETIMAEANIKTIILIQGVDAAHKTDDDIFKLIAKLEQEAASLNNITNKPKKLLAKIEEIKSDISKLVEFVDSRE